MCQYQDSYSCAAIKRANDENAAATELRCNDDVDKDTGVRDCLWDAGKDNCRPRTEMDCERWLKGRNESVKGIFSWGTDILQLDDQLASCGSLEYSYVSHSLN